MIRHFAHNHLSQHTGRSRALLDRLGWFGGSPDLACASVLLAGIFDYQHLRRNIFIALADFFADMTQSLLTIGALLIGFRQIVNNALALEMPRQCLPSARLLLAARVRSWRIGASILVIAFLFRSGCGMDAQFPCK